MRARSAAFNSLLLAVALAVSGAVAAGLAFLISPGLPWPVVFGLLWGTYLAFTAYALLRGTSMLLKELKALPLNLALHPLVGKALRESYGAGRSRAPLVMRASSRSINALSLGREDGGRLVLTDGALDGLEEGELRALLTRELTRMRGGDASIWLGYARLSIAPTLFKRLVSRGSAGPIDPVLNRVFFLGNMAFFAVFWLGLLLAAGGSGADRALLIIGMPSFTIIMTLLTNLFVSVLLLGLLRMLDWNTRELAADRAAAAIPGGRQAMASIFTKAEGLVPEAGTAPFDRSAWVGPIKLRKACFINPEAWYQVRGWNPQPTLAERLKALGQPGP